ncbi:hypothetical protein E4U22_001546, partial [Claviceps purpurea]
MEDLCSNTTILDNVTGGGTFRLRTTERQLNLTTHCTILELGEEVVSRYGPLTRLPIRSRPCQNAEPLARSASKM